MIDESLILKIRQLRARGKCYNEIASTLHISKSTISNILKAENSTIRSSTVAPASLDGVKKNIYRENSTLPPKPSFMEKKFDSASTGTMLVARSGGLYLVSMDNPGPSSSQLINAPLPSWFWKLFFISIGIVMFIRILKRMGGDTFENE